MDPVRRTPMLAPWSALLLAGACAVSDPDPQWIARQQAATAAEAAFALPAPLTAGFDEPAPDGLRPGDEVVYGLRLEQGGEVRDWFVRFVVVEGVVTFELHDGQKVRPLGFAAHVHDASGALLGSEDLGYVFADLTNGLARACRGESAPESAAGPFAPVPETVRATLALQNLLRVVRESDVLFDVLWEVIDKPSLWSILVHFGVRVQIAGHFDVARPAPPFRLRDGEQGDGEVRASEVPAWEVPIELQLNGAPALRSIVTVVDPDAPLSLGAGVVGVRAFRPSDPTVTFTMRMLAARRASAR